MSSMRARQAEKVARTPVALLTTTLGFFFLNKPCQRTHVSAPQLRTDRCAHTTHQHSAPKAGFLPRRRDGLDAVHLRKAGGLSVGCQQSPKTSVALPLQRIEWPLARWQMQCPPFGPNSPDMHAFARTNTHKHRQ